jgi:hypothetical protein
MAGEAPAFCQPFQSFPLSNDDKVPGLHILGAAGPAPGLQDTGQGLLRKRALVQLNGKIIKSGVL